MAEIKKMTKEQLTQIKEDIVKRLELMKKIYQQDIERLNAYSGCITLLDFQLKKIEEDIKNCEDEKK